MHVLIVEDDLDFQFSLVDLLAKLGYAVEAVGDGFSAAEKLPDTDVLLADISIPGMDGLELCSEARRHYPDVNVILMTGYDSPLARSEATCRGAEVYLVKPFDRDVLLAHLRRFENSHRHTSRKRPIAAGAGGGK
jgi:DNA-binding response OmpR family regulator